MSLYDFTLAFLVSPAGQDDVVASVNAGVPNASAILAQRGRIEVHFTRSSNSAYQVLKSAIADVHAVIPAAECILY